MRGPSAYPPHPRPWFLAFFSCGQAYEEAEAARSLNELVTLPHLLTVSSTLLHADGDASTHMHRDAEDHSDCVHTSRGAFSMEGRAKPAKTLVHVTTANSTKR